MKRPIRPPSKTLLEKKSNLDSSRIVFPARVEVSYKNTKRLDMGFLREAYVGDDYILVNLQGSNALMLSPERAKVYYDCRSCAEFIVDELGYDNKGHPFEVCKKLPPKSVFKRWPEDIQWVYQIHCLNSLNEDTAAALFNEKYHFSTALKKLRSFPFRKKDFKAIIRANGNIIEIMYVPDDYVCT